MARNVALLRLEDLADIENHPKSTSNESNGQSLPCTTEEWESLEAERRGYRKLLLAGGFPWYPLSMLEDVVMHPENHRALLAPWKIHDDDRNGTVFYEQFFIWRQFQKEQHNARQGLGLSQYQTLCESHLQALNITPHFALSTNPEDQSRQTTWLEYLAFLAGSLHKEEDDVERLSVLERGSWTELHESGVLRRGVTDEQVIARVESIFASLAGCAFSLCVLDTLYLPGMSCDKQDLAHDLTGSYHRAWYDLKCARTEALKLRLRFEGSLRQRPQSEAFMPDD